MSSGAVFFGRALRMERRFQNLTQEEVAKKAGIAGMYVCRIERGQVMPSYRTAEKLARAVGLPELMRLINVCKHCKQTIRKPRRAK